MAEKLEPLNPGWIGTKSESILTENFNKIYFFYVITTPVAKASTSSIPLSYNNRWPSKVWQKYPYLRDSILNTANLKLHTSYEKATKLQDMTGCLSVAGLNGKFQTSRDTEKIAFYKTGTDNDILELFYYIRCSLAHGRFQIYDIPNSTDKIYVMETGKKKKIHGSNPRLSVRARMILKESTLIRWKNIIEGGYTLLKAEQTAFEQSIQTDISNIVKSTPRITKSEIAAQLNCTESFAFSQIKKMCDSGTLKYQGRRTGWKI